MSSGNVRFIRIHNRVIPIPMRDESGKWTLPVVPDAQKRKVRRTEIDNRTRPIRPKQAFKHIGMGLAVLSGLVGIGSLMGGTKAFVLGTAVEYGLDAASATAAAAAYAGRGRGLERTKKAAKQAALQEAVGWGIFGAGLVGTSAGRKSVVRVAKAVGSIGARGFSILRRFI